MNALVWDVSLQGSASALCRTGLQWCQWSKEWCHTAALSTQLFLIKRQGHDDDPHQQLPLGHRFWSRLWFTVATVCTLSARCVHCISTLHISLENDKQKFTDQTQKRRRPLKNEDKNHTLVLPHSSCCLVCYTVYQPALSDTSIKILSRRSWQPQNLLSWGNIWRARSHNVFIFIHDHCQSGTGLLCKQHNFISGRREHYFGPW